MEKCTSENIARLTALYRDAQRLLQRVWERRSLFTERNCREFISKLMEEYLPDVPDMDEQCMKAVSDEEQDRERSNRQVKQLLLG